MKRARITIKNYRGFADAEPARLEIRPGFTALLGKNNSGKSSSKLFFYELRPLFEVLTRSGNINPGMGSVLTGQQIQTDYLGITDISELFNNTNDRPISFEIELVEADAGPEPYVKRPEAKDVDGRDKPGHDGWRGFVCRSFPRQRESSLSFILRWVPAFAGTSGLELQSLQLFYKMIGRSVSFLYARPITFRAQLASGVCHAERRSSFRF
jgi:hypothetical protein